MDNMNRYIEEASDLNVEGVEFYVKENDETNSLYTDSAYENVVDLKTLKHAFEMNDVVIIDNKISCRATNLEVKEGYVVITYLFPSVNDNVVSVTAKQVRSFDKTLVTDVSIASDTDLLGKIISDLQSDIEIGENEITGTLKHVTDYTGFSGESELQSGNFLALHITTNDGAPISVELIGGMYGPVTLDEDGIIILKIANKEQRVKVTSGSMTKEYSLVNINLLFE